MLKFHKIAASKLAPAFALSCNNGGMCSSPSAFTLFKASIHSPVSSANKSHPKTTYTRRQKLSPNNFNLEITNLPDAFDLFSSMIQTHPLPSVVRFNQLFGKIVRMKHYSSVSSLYKQMGPLGVVPDFYTLAILINLRNMSSSLSVLGKLIKFGYQPNTVIMNILIKGFFVEGKPAEAAKCFRKMTEAGCVPDMVTYNTLVNCFCKMGDTDSAIDLLEGMEAQFGKPNIITCNTIIDCLCKDRLFNGALNILSDMISQGIVPDVVTYNSLIHGACKLGQWK